MYVYAFFVLCTKPWSHRPCTTSAQTYRGMYFPLPVWRARKQFDAHSSEEQPLNSYPWVRLRSAPVSEQFLIFTAQLSSARTYCFRKRAHRDVYMAPRVLVRSHHRASFCSMDVITLT